MNAYSQPNPNQLILKPLILLADSQLLFLKEQQQPYIRRLTQLFDANKPLKAAYIGASNNDQSEFFDMFEQAMNSINIHQCMHIDSTLCATKLEFLASAQIILLAGGDTWLGWQTIKKIAPLIHGARNNGAVLIGTSAGAVQLGLLGFRDKPYLNNTDLFSTLGYIPAIFSPHEERQQWRILRQMVQQTAGTLPAIGIPSGAGVIVTPDNHIQAIRKPAVSFTIKGDKLIQHSTWKLQL